MLKIKKRLEVYKEKFLTPEKFSNLVYNHYVRNNRLVGYLDCVLLACRELGINSDEHEKIKKLITPDLKKRLQLDCEKNNMLTCVDTPKLPTFKR